MVAGAPREVVQKQALSRSPLSGPKEKKVQEDRVKDLPGLVDSYSIITKSLALRPKTSGEYISSALVGGTTNSPGVVARAMYE